MKRIFEIETENKEITEDLLKALLKMCLPLSKIKIKQINDTNNNK